MPGFHHKLIPMLLICLLLLSLGGCIPGAKPVTERETLYQVSLLDALLQGDYDGTVALRELKQKGNFGIGTFDKLDGEMVIIDGAIYQVKADGTVVIPDELNKTPFAVVSYFDNDKEFTVKEVKNLEELKRQLESSIDNKNLFYLFKISGKFSTVKVRSVPPQQKPYAPLAQVKQSFFDYNGVDGDIVALWCPAYTDGINLPGLHFHFISRDRSKGGHLLDLSFDEARATLDKTPNFSLVLPDTGEFGKYKIGGTSTAVENAPKPEPTPAGSETKKP